MYMVLINTQVICQKEVTYCLGAAGKPGPQCLPTISQDSLTWTWAQQFKEGQCVSLAVA